jgi:hypothetical protein
MHKLARLCSSHSATKQWGPCLQEEEEEEEEEEVVGFASGEEEEDDTDGGPGSKGKGLWPPVLSLSSLRNRREGLATQAERLYNSSGGSTGDSGRTVGRAAALAAERPG